MIIPDHDSLNTVTHVLVTSRLDVYNMLYVGLPLKLVQKPQVVQNVAGQWLTGAGDCQHIILR